MATSTGSRALDFALGIGAYAPQVDLPDDVLPPQQAPEEIVRRSGKVSPNSAEFAPLIKKAAEKYNIPYELLMGVAQQESSFNPNAVGPSTKYGHAKGMFQLIDATAKRYGVRNPFDPEDAAQGSARYLRDLMDRYNNDPKLAIAAYNAGEGNVDKYLRGERDLPDQTKDYLPKVMGHMAAFTGGQGMPAAAPGVEPGMRQIMLTNGSPMVVPEAMTNEQVLEHIRKSPNPELSRLAPAQEVAIDGKNVLVPFNMTNEDEIRHHMVNEGVLPDPTAGKGGRYWNNMVSGLETMLGNAALSTGNKEMAQQFYDKARAGEYQMYESEVDAAKRRGVLPGLMAEAKQNLLYPGATMLGQYAPAMVPTSGLLGAAAKLAAMTPSATGEVMRYAQERGVDISPEEALRQGIPLAAVESFGLPLKGVGGAAGAAEKGLLRRTAEAGATNFAKNVAAMTAMEGLQKAGAGEPVLPQTPEEMKRIAEAAAWFAGPHAIGAGLMPRAVEEAPRSDIGAMRPEPRREVPTEPVEPEMVREEPTVEPTTVTRTQNEIIGEAYADHVRNSMARGEEPMAPEEFFQREANQIRETEAAGAAPPTEIIQPYLDLAAQRPAAEPTPYTPKSREVPGAEQVVETGAPDGRRSAQPGFREEGRDQAVGGQGMEPSGQGVKAPEVSKEIPTWDTIRPGQFIDLYRGEHATNEKGGGWWSTDPEVAKKYARKDGSVEKVTLPSELIMGHALSSSRNDPTYFGFDKHRPFDLAKADKERSYAGLFSPESREALAKTLERVRKNLAEDGSLTKAEADALDARIAELRTYKGEEKSEVAPEKEVKRTFPKTKPPSEVYPALPFIPKVELDRLPEEHRVEYHQMRGEALKKLKPAQVELLSERDKLDYHQYKGLHNAEIAKEMGYSGREETLRKLEEHELQNLEVGLNKPMSKAREDYLEAQREEQAKYRAPTSMDEVVPRDWKAIEEDLNATVGELNRLREEKAPISESLDLNQHLEFLRAEAAKGGFHNEHALWEQKQRAAEAESKSKAKAPKKVDEVELARKKEKEEAKKAQEEYDQEEEERKKEFEQDEEGIYELPEFDYTEPDRELDYTKGEAPREAHTPESLTQHISAEYGARRPAVEITTREKAGVDASTKAFYDPKTKRVHLIADNLGKGDSIHGILKHEIGVHAQKLGVKDPEFQGILRHMQGMQAKGVKAVREAYAKVPEGTRPERVHEEALGYLVEHHPNIPLVRRFMSWLRRMAHKLTGNAGWLKPEDLSQMAHRILKKDYGVESRPERRDVQTEKLRSVRDDNIKAIRERGITKTEKTLTYKETGAKALEFAKEAKKNFRTEIVDTTDPMTRHLQELDRFIPELGKLRADAIAIEANQGVGLVGHAIEAGIPVINKSGSMMVVPGANLKSAIEFAKSKEKGGEELLSFVLRVNIGEHRIKEHAQDIKDIARLREDIMNLEHMEKFHKKLGFMKERDKVKKELEAKKSNLNTIFRERNIDPETMEGREKLVDANDIALRDKIMKDHPWLDQPVKEIYTAMQGLVDFYKDSGMIDKITADKWKEAPYIPLYKSLEDLAKDPNFKKLFPRTAESLHEIQQIKGFKHSVNVLENLHKHYYGMMLPAIFNHTRKQFVEQSLHLDALHKMNEEPGLSYDRALRKATEATQKYKGSKNTVKVMENGEEKHFVVQDPDLLHMLSFERPEIGPVARFFRPGATVKRTMFLKNPGFWGTQLLLDPLFANLTAGSKHLIHPGQAIGNLFKIWMGKSEGGKALEAHGVDVGHHDYAGEKALSYAGMGEATQFHELFGKKSMFRKAMNLLDKVHNTVDEATRVAVYDAVKKDGKKMGLSGQALEDYAVDRARRYINFSARGKNNVLNEYRAMTAFTSAAINGADALVRNARGYGLNAKEAKEVRQIFWKRFMAGMAIGTGAAIAQLGSYDGDKNGDLYDQLTSINIGDWLKIPMKWDVGALVYGLPKVFVMTTMLDSSDPNSLTVRQGTKAAFDLIVKNMFPPVHLPDMINPLVEAVANRHLSLEDTDYIESPGSLRYAADARGRTNTFLGEFFGNLVGVSGKKADYIGRNYLGKFYEFSNAVAGAITDRSAGMPGAEMAIPKTLGAGTFMQDTNRVYGADRIYDAEERAQQELAAFNKFRTQNKDKLEEFKQDKERMLYKNAAPMLRNVRENLGAIEKRISQIMDSKAPEAAKESQIKQLTERKRALVEQGNKLIKQRLGEYAP